MDRNGNCRSTSIFMGSTIKNIKMKKILSLIVLIISLQCFSQNNRISVQIQTRDCEYILSKSKILDDWYTLDSALMSKGDSIVANNATAPVTLGGVPEKVWRDVMRILRTDLYARAGNTISRVDAALTALNISWLSTRLASDETDVASIWTAVRQAGRKRARKDNDISNQ